MPEGLLRVQATWWDHPPQGYLGKLLGTDFNLGGPCFGTWVDFFWLYSALSNFLEVSCQNVLTKPNLTCHSQFLPDIVDGNFKNYWRDDSIIYSFIKTLLESV